MGLNITIVAITSLDEYIWISRVEENCKKHPQIVEIPQFARNRSILQETDQNLPDALAIARSQRRLALPHVNVLYCERHLFMSKAPWDKAAEII